MKNKEKEKKTKELKFIEKIKRKRSVTFVMDQSDRAFWIFVGDKILDWSEREGN